MLHSGFVVGSRFYFKYLFKHSYLGHGHVGLQLVYLLAQPRLIRAVYNEAVPVIDSYGTHSDTPGGGLFSPLRPVGRGDYVGVGTEG